MRDGRSGKARDVPRRIQNESRCAAARTGAAWLVCPALPATRPGRPLRGHAGEMMGEGSLLTILTVIAAIQTPLSGFVLLILNDLRSRLAHLERQHMEFGRKGEPL